MRQSAFSPLGRVFVVVSSLLPAGLLGTSGASSPAFQQELVQEEEQDYFQRWLNEDVVYIITPEEREVFQKLTTPEEKEKFIEQFWRRRDPDLKTEINEFKEEHYRRIAYANEHFASGKSGWKTDRGRIYIIHGPPDAIEDYPSGGPYERPIWEGGGNTSTFPYQVWRYRYIEGIGSEIELEFVDSTLTGAYHLAHDPFEKDAFAHVPGIGLTLAEERGLASKHDRFLRTTGSEYYPLMYQRDQDKPFIRFERYVGVQRPKQIKYRDLQELVQVDVNFQNLPFRFRQDHFRLNHQHVLIPITLELNNKDLSYREEKGVQSARLAIYGIVTSLSNEIIKEFEDEVLQSFPADRFQENLLGRSTYQKIIALEQAGRYKLTLVVQDVHSGKVGVLRRALVPPQYGEEDLVTSSLILSDAFQQVEEVSQDEMFLLGDVKIRPSLEKVFSPDRVMGVYLQLYNVGFDQATLRPSLKIRYRLFSGDRRLFEIADDEGESIQFFSGQRVVLLKSFSPHALPASRYRIEVQVHDEIRNQTVLLGDEFEVGPSREMALGR